jgi:hypothetical protein
LENLLYAGYGWITNPVYEDWTYVDQRPEVAYYNQYSNVYLSRYRDLQYKFYKIGRSYLDDYYLNIDDENYIKDEEQSKEYYLYAYNIEPLENTEDNGEDTPDNTQNDNDEQTEVENNNDDSSDEEGINENDTIEDIDNNQNNGNTELEQTNDEIINDEKIVTAETNNNKITDNNIQTKKKINSSNNYVAINIDNGKDKIEENKLINNDNKDLTKENDNSNKEQNIINASPIYKTRYVYNKNWYMLVLIIAVETLIILILILLKRKNRKCVV